MGVRAGEGTADSSLRRPGERLPHLAYAHLRPLRILGRLMLSALVATGENRRPSEFEWWPRGTRPRGPVRARRWPAGSEESHGIRLRRV